MTGLFTGSGFNR